MASGRSGTTEDGLESGIGAKDGVSIGEAGQHSASYVGHALERPGKNEGEYGDAQHSCVVEQGLLGGEWFIRHLRRNVWVSMQLLREWRRTGGKAYRI